MNTLRLNSKDRKIWFVSDIHWGHNKDFILNPRGYSTVEEAMKDTKEKWIQYIGPNDIVFNLGDIIIGVGTNGRSVLNELLGLPFGHEYFLFGNHNSGVKELYVETLKTHGYDENIEVYPLEVPGRSFTFLGQQVEIIIDGKTVVLSHYPLASWNHMSKGSYMLHGHCHRNMKDDVKLKRLDLGWDWKKRPVSWEEIVEELEKRVFVPIDHHGHNE